MDAFPFFTDFEVRYGDLDTLGHVNNVAYFVYMETARLRYIMALGERIGQPLPDIVVGSARCDYRTPAYFGETMRVGVRVTRVGRSSVDLAYRIAQRDSGRLVAEGHSVTVFVDPASGRSTPLPPDWREVLAAEAAGA